jgi:hypothetical protein
VDLGEGAAGLATDVVGLNMFAGAPTLTLTRLLLPLNKSETPSRKEYPCRFLHTKQTYRLDKKLVHAEERSRGRRSVSKLIRQANHHALREEGLVLEGRGGKNRKR